MDPILGEDRPFTVWGFLSTIQDTQQVRIFTIEEQLGVDRPNPIDATVMTTDLNTGEQQMWTPRQVTFSDSTTGHVFWAAFRPEHEHTYRLEVRRSDGEVTRAEVFVPAPVEVQVPEAAANQTKVSIRIQGQTLTLLSIRAVYSTFSLPPLNPWPPGSAAPISYQVPVAVSYDGEQKTLVDGWLVEVDLREDIKEVVETYVGNCLPIDNIGLTEISLEFIVANEEWNPPGGVFDPEVLIEPGTLSNVENGFGFFGAGYVAKGSWRPSESIIRSVGFSLEPPCSFMPLNIPECQLPPDPCFDMP